MRRRVIGVNGIATMAIDLLVHQSTRLNMTCAHLATQQMHAEHLVSKMSTVSLLTGHQTRIADLATASVKWCLIEHQGNLVALFLWQWVFRL